MKSIIIAFLLGLLLGGIFLKPLGAQRATIGFGSNSGNIIPLKVDSNGKLQISAS